MKKIIFMFALAAISVLWTGCKNNDEPKNVDFTGITWELVAFVENGKTTPEPGRGPESDQDYGYYWIRFNQDGTISGESSSNDLKGTYSIDFSKNTFEVLNVSVATYVMEVGNGEKFLNCLNTITKFSSTDSSLKLYYTAKDYLLFKISVDE